MNIARTYIKMKFMQSKWNLKGAESIKTNIHIHKIDIKPYILPCMYILPYYQSTMKLNSSSDMPSNCIFV